MDLKEKFSEMPSYVKYGTITVLLLWLGYAWYVYISTDKKWLETVGNIKWVNIKDIDKNTNKVQWNWKLDLKDKKPVKTWTGSQTWTWVIKKDVAQATSDSAIKNALWVKGNTNTKYLTWEKVDLKNIQTNDFIQLKDQVRNVNTLPKDFLRKFKAKQIANYKKLIRQDIVKQYWVKKIIWLDIKMACKYYPAYCGKNYIIIPTNKISSLLWDLNLLKVEEKKNCTTVLWKENCKVSKEKYIVYKGKYIKYNMLYKLSTSNIKSSYIILLGREINNKIVVDKYIIFHDKYGWYWYEGLKLYKTAIEKNNYQVMYIYDKYKIDSIAKIYNKDIIWKVQLILWSKIIK